MGFSPPSHGDTLNGTISLTADAGDAGPTTGLRGVDRLEFFLDSQLLSRDHTAPYAYSWDTTQVANGTYTLTAHVFDHTGNHSNDAVPITVANTDTTPPSVALLAPKHQSKVFGIVSAKAKASDAGGVHRIEFFLDGQLLGQDFSDPYTLSWDTRTVPDGSYTVKTVAYDISGNANSDGVEVRVANAP